MMKLIKKSYFFILFSVISSALFALINNLCFPVLPGIAQELKGTESMIHYSLFVFILGACVSQLIFGYYADKIGRRKIIILGVIINIMGGGLAFLSINPAMFIFARLLQGIGMGPVQNTASIILKDALSDENNEEQSIANLSKIFAYTRSLTTFMPAFAMFIGGSLYPQVGWRSLFIVMIIFSLAYLLLLYYRLPETLKKNIQTDINPNNFLKNYKSLMFDPIFMKYNTTMIVINATVTLYFSLSPFFYLEIFKIPDHTIGYVTAIAFAGLFIGRSFTQFLHNKLSINGVIQLGVFISFLGGLGFLLSSCVATQVGLGVFMVAAVIFTTGIGIMNPNINSKLIHNAGKKASSSMALTNVLNLLASGLLVALFSLIPFHSLIPLGIMMFVMPLLSLGLMFWGFLSSLCEAQKQELT